MNTTNTQTLSVEEGNKLIAIFDGWQHYPTPKAKGDGYWSNSQKGMAQFSLLAMKYHTSWDWLMPVVDKMRTISVKFLFLQNHQFIILRSDVKEGIEIKSDGVSVLSAFYAVVQFIQWYNNQSIKQP